MSRQGACKISYIHININGKHQDRETAWDLSLLNTVKHSFWQREWRGKHMPKKAYEIKVNWYYLSKEN